jgi:hypothetical protein
VSDIVERLRKYVWEDHERGCQGRSYDCSCGHDRKGELLLEAAADEITRLRALNAELVEALQVCDRVLHFDLRSMITWGKDYNQAVKDAADTARAAITKAGESND